jgi:hypothetical protein
MEARPTPAEDLPTLYRGILEGVARLERLGARREAGLLRADATRIYSTAWDEAGLRRLRQISARNDRVIAGDVRPRTARRRPRGLPERLGPTR